VIASFHTRPGEIVHYGALDIERLPQLGRLMRVRDVIEKPTVEEAPSRFAVAGRYVLGADVLAALDEIEPSTRGEIELTDALALAALRERPVFALPLASRHFDLGSWNGYEKAVSFLTR
jgi:UTP--glucose-1-phosphate uridylyltransferase